MTHELDMESQPGRGRRAAVDVAIVMVGVALVSIVVVAVFNYFAARALLNGAIDAQLAEIASSRGSRIEDGTETIGAYATTLAADKGMQRALQDLSEGYSAVDTSLDSTQTGELRVAYEAGIAAVVPEGIEAPPVDDLLPTSDRAQYLQYHYIVQNEAEDRSELVDPGDGSPYSAVHALHHPALRSLSQGLDMGDMLLIDADSASVVYSVEKRTDFGTDLVRGPYDESALAEAVVEQLGTAGSDEAVFVDFEPYAPAGGDALLFVAASIRDQGRVVGAVALEVPNETLTALTTSSQDWKGTGLGDTGEIYVVGGDTLMRSDARLWLEDQDTYLETIADAGYGEDVADRIVAYDSTVLAQPVETEAVETALDGDVYVDVTDNYLAQQTLTVAGPLDVGDLDWVVVADMTTDEAYAPLRSYTVTLLVLAVILAPAVAGFAVLISRKMLAPIGPIVGASERVSEGSLEVSLPDFGQDEWGDISAKFNDVVGTLRDRETELRQAEAETTELLMAVMPSDLADQVRRGGKDVAEVVQDATLVAIRITEPSAADQIEQEARAEHTVTVSTGIADLAAAHGAQLLRSSATEHLYATGLASHDDSSEAEPAHGSELEAVAFAEDVRGWVGETAASGELALDFRAGLAAGDVVAGVVGTGRIAFTVWGRPRRRSAELVSVAEPGQILVDPTVAGRVGDAWLVEPMTDLVDLRGDPLDGWRVAGAKGRT